MFGTAWSYMSLHTIDGFFMTRLQYSRSPSFQLCIYPLLKPAMGKQAFFNYSVAGEEKDKQT